jgi:hypothetical protein
MSAALFRIKSTTRQFNMDPIVIRFGYFVLGSGNLDSEKIVKNDLSVSLIFMAFYLIFFLKFDT